MSDTFTTQELEDYAALLHRNGFTIRVSKGAGSKSGRKTAYFIYSRPVLGRELFGNVQRDGSYIGQTTYSHHMPIAPTRENGSSMFVPEVDRMLWNTLAAAIAITRPQNRNNVVGTQRNHDDMARWGHTYTIWTPAGDIHDHHESVDAIVSCDQCAETIDNLSE